MDHGDTTKHSTAPQLGPPSRGIGVWSFATKNLDQIYENALNGNVEILSAPDNINSPFLDARGTLLLLDPGGFPLEVFEV